ncbi:MAG: efflux RND transporter periplasmic adaptor subunit [Balneolaceae bacterium]
MNSISVTLPVIVLMILFTVVSCGGQDEETVNRPDSIEVNVQNARIAQKVIARRFAGVVVSSWTASLSTTIMGTITRIDVDEGDAVEQGEVLVRIKDDHLNAQRRQVQSNLDGARATLANAKANYQRIRVLHERDSATKQELDEMTSRYEMASANVHSLENKLKEIREMLAYTTLKAPFDGHVVSKLASESDMASPGQPLLVLEQQGQSEFHITVPESEITHLSIQDTVSIQLPAVDISNEMGVISNIHPAGAPGSRQFTVEVLPVQPERMRTARSGMFVEIALANRGEQAVLVPRSAILERGQLTGLYTVNEESELILRWVRLGELVGSNVEILSGLSEGEVYVSSIDSQLQEGQTAIIH